MRSISNSQIDSQGTSVQGEKEKKKTELIIIKKLIMNFIGQRSQERTHTPLTFSTTKSSKLGTANLKKQNSTRKSGAKTGQNAERTAEELIDR